MPSLLPPKKGQPYTFEFVMRTQTGELAYGAAGLDAEFSADGGALVNCTITPTEVPSAGPSGLYTMTVTGAEHIGDRMAVKITSTTPGVRPTVERWNTAAATFDEILDVPISSRHAAGAAVASVAGSVGSVAGNVGGNVAGSVGSVIGAVSVGSIAADAIADAQLAADTDVYGARIGLIDDNAGTTDRYVVIFMKNGMPVVAGITLPKIRVYDEAEVDLIAETALTEIGVTGTYTYPAVGAERIVDGAAYVAKITATIDGSPRTMFEPVGRDST